MYVCGMFLREVELGHGAKSRVCFCCFVKQLGLSLCKRCIKGEGGSCMEMTRTELSRSTDPGANQAIDQPGFHV